MDLDTRYGCGKYEGNSREATTRGGKLNAGQQIRRLKKLIICHVRSGGCKSGHVRQQKAQRFRVPSSSWSSSANRRAGQGSGVISAPARWLEAALVRFSFSIHPSISFFHRHLSFLKPLLPTQAQVANRKMKLKDISRTATFAWDNTSSSAPLLATGAVAGALDESFSNESQLEIWQPDFGDVSNVKLGGEGKPALGSITVSSR